MYPTIDFARFRNGDEATRREVAYEIARACGTSGYLYLTTHGIDPSILRGLRNAAESYFKLPEARKRVLERPSGRYRGYTPLIPFGEEAGDPPVMYEQFVIGIEIDPDHPMVKQHPAVYWPNPWPDEPREFKQAVLDYWHAMTDLSIDLVRAFSIALGIDEETLTGLFELHGTDFALIHYTARPEGIAPSPSRGHEDGTVFTPMLVDELGGLQLRSLDRGWVDAPVDPSGIVILMGRLMEIWSGGRFPATIHRVNPPVGRERHSFAYFLHPDYDTVVEPVKGVPRVGPEARLQPWPAGPHFEEFVVGFEVLCNPNVQTSEALQTYYHNMQIEDHAGSQQ